ncbi:TonB-dependent receptor [Croceicoccus mobilis]|uniref:Membrane protein n=1 Tax=Croceicoccus mobilis TaxID=1703339 RepID=A0A916YQM0_9SPHN|nr:TonB-dependent receptor [Croceicoccus mobilis]GGD56517.1 membrane protein [Croceicoccus mobilis]
MKLSNLRKRALSAGSALNALALVGAGAGVAAIAAAPAHAQDYTNITASGRVVSVDGTPVSGATVTVVSDDQGFSRTATTDGSGTFRLVQLPPGDYTVTIVANDYETYSESIALSQSSAANQFALVPSNYAGEIVVTAGRSKIIDFERTTTGLVLDVAELAQRVPVARDLTSIIELSPGVSAGDSAFGNLASISGSSVSENAYYVNGLNITDFRKGLGSATVPFDFYETVEVKNGGYQAEFGRATGGVVNATTKSGSNEFHGSVLFNYEPDDLRSDSPDTRNPLTGDSLYIDNSLDNRERIDTVVQLSGPIWKDRLFFYGIYNHRDVKTGGGIATANRYDETTTDDPFYGGKLDFVPFDGHRFEGTYFNTEGVQTTKSFAYDPETDEIGDYLSSELLEYGSENYVGRYTGNFTDWFVFSAAYGKSKLRENTVPQDQTTPYSVDNRSGTPLVIGNPSAIIEIAEDEREFYRFDADFYVDFLGSHHFRAGYDNEKLTSDNRVLYTGNVVWNYFTAGADDNYAPEGTDYASGRTFISGGIFQTENEAFYIQDNWSLLDNRLQLQLGLRNDRFVNKNADGDVFYASGDQWGPRLGFTLDAFGDQRTKVYGSFGRYYLPIPSNTNIRLAGAEFDLERYYELDGVNADGSPILGDALIGFDGSAPCYDTGIDQCENISDGTAVDTRAAASQDLKPQSVDEYILGGEVRVGDRWKFGLFGTYRSLNRSLEDAAIDAAVNAYCDSEGLDCTNSNGSDIWSGFHQYVLINPGDPQTITLSDPVNGESELRTVSFSAEDLGYPAAKRTYKAITATFDREFDGVWSLSGSYTYSQTKGNIEGGVKSDNGQDDSGITTDFDQPGFTYGAYGYLPNHRAHNFKIFGAYQATDWLLLGANAKVSSPRKFGCIGRIPSSVDAYATLYGGYAWYCNVDDNGDIITSGSVPSGTTTLTPRGSRFESDWLTQLDVSAVVSLPTDFDAKLRLDVFNVFNSKAELDFEERGTLSNYQPRNTYGLTTGYQTPRYVRVQLQVGF